MYPAELLLLNIVASHSCTATILFDKIVAVACPERSEGFGNSIGHLIGVSNI